MVRRWDQIKTWMVRHRNPKLKGIFSGFHGDEIQILEGDILIRPRLLKAILDKDKPPRHGPRGLIF
jgi:hypothetical protein